MTLPQFSSALLQTWRRSHGHGQSWEDLFEIFDLAVREAGVKPQNLLLKANRHHSLKGEKDKRPVPGSWVAS